MDRTDASGGRRFGALATALWCAAAPAAAAPAAATADGVRATLRMDGDGAVVSWSFLRRPPAPVSAVAVTLDGRPLGVPLGPFTPFPGPGQSAALLCLVGRDGPDIGGELSGLVPGGRLAVRSVRLGGGAEASDRRSADPAEAARRALDQLAAAQGGRRVLVVAPGNAALLAMPADALAEQAEAHGIALVFAPGAGPPAVDLPSLERAAERTGGRAVPPGGDLAAALLDGPLSGADIRFPLGGARPYIWERSPTAVARISYGERALEVSVPVDVPTAGLSATLLFAWARVERRWPAFAGGFTVALIGVLVLRNRPRARG